MNLASVKALTFDVFGTVVDWRAGISRDGRAFGVAKGIDADWEKFAEAWRRLYGPSMEEVRSGRRPWVNLDTLHRESLTRVLAEFNMTGATESEVDDLSKAWHRLDPWPEAISGLTRLKERFVLATLSNGNIALMVNMAKRAGLPWDVILGAEVVKHYKPQPEVYLGAAELLGLRPNELLMVAAHPGDLAAARNCGLQTAYVSRPDEFGPDRRPEIPAAGSFDVHATDFEDLATKLGC